MKRRAVRISGEALRDLAAIGDYIAERSGVARALNYVRRIEAFCLGLDLASERGAPRDDLLPGLRVIGFERRATIAFLVAENDVVVVGIYARGFDWTKKCR